MLEFSNLGPQPTPQVHPSQADCKANSTMGGYMWVLQGHLLPVFREVFSLGRQMVQAVWKTVWQFLQS